MNVRELRRHKWLHYTELPYADRVSVMVIHGLETVYEPITDDRGFQIGEEPVHLMHFVGYPKAMKLNNTRLDVLDSLFGPETDEWVGRKVGLIPAAVTYYGKTQIDITVWAQPVDQYEPTPPVSRRFAQAVASSKANPPGAMGRAGNRTLPAPVAGPAIGAEPAWDPRPIGGRNADSFSKALAEQGVTYDDFARWLKSWDIELYERAVGRALDDLPRGLAPVMQLYLRDHASKPAPAAEPAPSPVGQGGPKAAAPAASPGSVAGSPGTVRRAASPPVDIAFGAPSPSATYEPVTEDDIPF